MRKAISAIVVNYNAGHLLQQCINALSNCQLVSEIIIVDNASTDSSLETILNNGKIFITQNSSNLGFAAACNQGIRHSKNEFLLFLNPDCSFPLGTLELMMDAIQDNSVGMVGGLLISPDDIEQPGSRRIIPTPWRSFVRAFGLHKFGDRWPKLFSDFNLHLQPLPALPFEVEALSGACMLVKREAINDVGLWDEGYFLHCEDLDLCMRFRQKGWKILLSPQAKITHIAGTCSRSRPIFVEWHKHKGMLRFYRKFFRHQYPGFLMWLVTLGVWFRFILVAGYYLFTRIFNPSKSSHV